MSAVPPGDLAQPESETLRPRGRQAARGRERRTVDGASTKLGQNAAEFEMPRDAEAGASDMPCFRRLPGPSFFRGAAAPRPDTVHERTPARPAHADRQGAEGSAEALESGAAVLRNVYPRFLLVCVFVAGFVAGGGVTFIARDDAMGRGDGGFSHIATPSGWPEPGASAGVSVGRRTSEHGDGAIDSSIIDKDLSSDTPPPPGAEPSDVDVPGAASLTASAADASAMMDRLEREIFQRQFDQPQADNALDTYRQIAAQSPDDAARAGRRLGAALWSAADSARASGHWDDALHYLDILKTLPPSPPAPVATARSAR
jgi:hypothetical protein